MICFATPFQGKEVDSVNEAIEMYRTYLNDETSLDIELIYFSPIPLAKELFVLKFLLGGLSDNKLHAITVLDEITQEEADASWVTIYK